MLSVVISGVVALATLALSVCTAKILIDRVVAGDKGRKLKTALQQWWLQDTTERATPEETGVGFSLVEAFVLASIVLIVSTIAVPNLMKSRVEQSEPDLARALASLNSALTEYGSQHHQFPQSLGDVDDVRVMGTLKIAYHRGYKLEYRPVERGDHLTSVFEGYELWLTPQEGVSSNRPAFYTDESGVIRAIRSPL